MNKNDSILILGGGIAGLQAAIDLAGCGFRVCLVERSPSIGGRMAQLDKTFPTNDCAMCILAPKMIECASHPLITLLTYSELESFTGSVGRFTAIVRKKSRFIDESKCTGCGQCAEVCPVEVPSEFEMGLAPRKAVYKPFPQAVPNVFTITKGERLPKKGKRVRYSICRECRLCEKACEAGAVDLKRPDEVVTLKVGACVIATGFEMMDVSLLSEYGGGKIANVVTGLDPDLASTIFYMDLRAAGKTFQDYVTRAQAEYAVKYVRARPGLLEEDEDTGGVRVVYEDTMTREKKAETFDMAVLCQALIPAGAGEIASLLGVDLDEHGFIKTPDPLGMPVDTTRPGIYTIGYAAGPKDIPDSVVEASAAAGRIAEILTRVKSYTGQTRHQYF
jgi:heterodisulfide reductase subunit A